MMRSAAITMSTVLGGVLAFTSFPTLGAVASSRVILGVLGGLITSSFLVWLGNTNEALQNSERATAELESQAQILMREIEIARHTIRSALRASNNSTVFASAAAGEVDSMINKDTPSHYICCITQELIKNPVKAPDGHCYEQTALQAWFDHGGRACPLNRSCPLTDPASFPIDTILQAEIQRYVKEQREARVSHSAAIASQ